MIQQIDLPADVSLAPVTIVHAGRLTCMYEKGVLRYIKMGDTELLRMIYGAVRDEAWGTLPYTIAGEEHRISNNGFLIKFAANYTQQEKVVYSANYSIEGRSDNSLHFSIRGLALAPFKKNRIGLCVLHPIKECRGRAVTITRPDGSNYQSVFPEMISLHQPLLNIQQMEWTTEDDTVLQLTFSGDVFETEDQRNWSDSSYKTYSTPLAVPYPVDIAAGDSIQQTITFRVIPGKNVASKMSAPLATQKIPFPKIGFCRSPNQSLLGNTAIALLRKIPFHHYRVTLYMGEQPWQETLHQAIEEVMALQTRLELVVFFSDRFEVELTMLLQMLAPSQQLVYSMLVLRQEQGVTPAALMRAAHPSIKKWLPGTLAGYGTNSFFADLNRQRPVGIDFDFVSFHLHPQVHAADNRTVLDNLESQPDLLATANGFAGGKPVFISPVTFQDPNSLAGTDNRAKSNFAAWFTLMSIQQLAMAGSITCCTVSGSDGLLQMEENPVPGAEGNVLTSPLYHALTAIQSFNPIYIIKQHTGDTIVTDGLLLENGTGARLHFKTPAAWVGFQSFSENL
ncbi:MAG: hypothetical protein ABIU63_18825 [Chitinophagaceae bacterium]